MRVILDCMIYDRVVTDPKLRELIEQCQRKEALVLLNTTVQIKQLSDIPCSRNKGQASALQEKRIGTAVFLLNYSILNVDCLGADKENEIYNRLCLGNPKHAQDDLLAVTAMKDADAFVTDDKSLSRRVKREAPNFSVLSLEEFRLVLISLLGAD